MRLMKTFAATAAAILVAFAGLAAGIGIIATVDDQVVSTVDMNERIALVMATAGIPETPENRARIAPQILHQLIDEKLQLAEAAKDGITINDAKLHEGLAKIERQNGKAQGSLERFVESKGLSKLSLYAQIRAQMAWSEIVLKEIRPRIRVSDRELAGFVKRKETAAPLPTDAQGKIEEVLIAAIHMPVDAPKNEANVHRLADKLAGEIRAGASFEAVASQFSSSALGTKATQPFWVELDQVDPAIARALVRVPKGGITDPVRTPTGYQIIKLADVRRSQEAPAPAPAAASATAPAMPVDEQRAELVFKQILMSLKPDAKPKEAEMLLGLAKEVQVNPGKCEDSTMAGVGDLADMDFRLTLTRAMSTDLPEKLRDFLLRLPIGGASDPVITPQGIRIFMLCERINLPPAKKVAATASENDAATRQAIYAEKLELEAQKFMRNLRREAAIEIRGE